MAARERRRISAHAQSRRCAFTDRRISGKPAIRIHVQLRASPPTNPIHTRRRIA